MSMITGRLKQAGAVALTAAIALVSPALGAADEAAMEEGATAKELQREWGEAIETLKGYSVQQRDKALEQGREMLSAMDERLDRLDARAEAEWSELSVEARKQRLRAMRTLRQQRNQLAEWYGGLKHGSAGAWSEVKEGFAAAYDRLAASMGRAMEEFESEPAQE